MNIFLVVNKVITKIRFKIFLYFIARNFFSFEFEDIFND